ncbi:MAG TPA: mannosyltransferase family protein, partial [Ktedonobacterales bacterium]
MQLALKRKWAVPTWVIEAGGLWLGQHIVVFGLVAAIQLILLTNGFSLTVGASGFPLLGAFLVWDNQWYTHIAQFGYDLPFTSAYPPLYPLLEALLTPLVGSAAVAGFVIANVAGLGACLLLRWVLDPVIGARASQRTLLYLLCFPMAVFFMAAYTESLFLLLSLAVFAALQRRAFWWAGLFAGL